jgi:hypothetical protein
MADSNKVQLKQFSDGSALTETGTPRYEEPLVRSQNQHDTLKVSVIELEVANGAADVVYPTGGFPLADDGGVEIAPDADTPDEFYKFSAFAAKGALRAGEEFLRIQSVHLDEMSTGDGELVECRYDAVKDKLRLISLVDGSELAKGDVILGEGSEKRLRLRVTFV